MVSNTKHKSKHTNSMVYWVVGIPLSLLVLVLFIFFVQPWGEPREAIMSTVPRDGDFYDPSTDQSQSVSTESSLPEESSVPDGIQPRIGSSEIVDVNLASWKPVDESTVPEDQLPVHSADVEGRVLVELSFELWSKVVGDRVQFSIPQQEVVLIGKLTKVDDTIAHTRILEGTLEDSAQEYTFVLTLGDTSTYAHINTAKGSVELVGTRTHGWLMESAKIAPDVDFSLPDHFFVDPDPRDRILEPEPPSESDE
ncbi:MAG: hypothetical protein OXH31_10680 [Gammaproteobacteria bacterium]|nr:hypothetical protein [Gammaproteobacteria bacterium]